ncbi:hypothetical protein [Rhizobium sp. 9140]|uniref:hypothetical protein n=1 Tax=Rhizobium sp. 9140 TaxID=1761900 RepID=UPI000A58CD54
MALGIMEAGALKSDLVEACENLRMGTALFAKVWRIVMNWYGDPTAKEVLPQVFNDAIIAWQTGYFEGTAVFRIEDPGKAKTAQPEQVYREEVDTGQDPSEKQLYRDAQAVSEASDANKAGICVPACKIDPISGVIGVQF